MGKMDVKIEGLEKLQKAFAKAPELVAGAFKKAIQKAAFGIEAAAKPITPIDTGFLRNSISTSLFTDAIGAQVINAAPYASYVHEGTESWPLSMAPKNGNTVRQFFLEAVQMTEVARDALWQEAADEVVHGLAK